jgi:hypothetical protein
MRAKLALALALALPGVSALTAQSASAFDLVDYANTSCSSAWSGGAYAALRIEDHGVWNSARSLHIDWSNTWGDLWGCQQGGRQTGGSKKLTSSWTVRGSGIQSCSLGTTTGCSFYDNQTVARSTHNSGWLSNGNGHVETLFSGANVYASQNGELNSYTHDANASFTRSGATVTAQSANYAYR